MLIGYARVSTEDQDTALQRDALTAAGCGRIFDETASGARVDRQQLQAAIDFARDGDSLVVWKLDRLARSLTQLIQTVEELERRGVGFLSLTESIDTTTAGGRLVFHIFGALAEFERAIIRERTRAGLLAARDRGRKGGRRPSLSETDMGAARALLASPDLSFGEVARRLHVSKGTLYRYFPGGRGNLRT
jgi:DNA invertase Pin-like site-specific DNA recombinase